MTPPKLEVDYRRQDGELQVTYTVSNPAREALWLVDRLWSYTPEGDIVAHPRPAYLSVHVDGAVKIGRCMHPLPRERDVEQTLVPFARKLESMQSDTEVFTIPAPLKEYNPYYGAAEPEDELQVESTSVQLVISWVPELPGMTSVKTPVDGALDLDAPGFLAELRILASPKVALTLPARRRTDQFERF